MQIRHCILATALASILLLSRSSFSQIGNTTTDTGMKPYGSYHSGDIDSLSFVNGKIDLHAPLISWPQRGKLRLGFTIRYDNPRYSETKDQAGTCGTTGNPCTYQSNYDSLGVVVTPDFGYNIYEEDKIVNGVAYPTYSVLSPDGSSHVLLGSETGDASGIHWDKTNNIITDREGIRHYLGASMHDFTAGQLPTSTATSKVEDSNGNQITLGSNGYTDSIGRVIPKRSSTTDYSQCTGPIAIYSAQLWQVPGPQGTNSTYNFCYVQIQLNFNLLTGLYHYPFNEYVTLLQSIVLPNGTAWTFAYDGNWGMLTKVTLPTGGSISYGAGVVRNCGNSSWPYQYNARYSRRSINANDGNGDHQWSYQFTWSSSALTTTVTDPLSNAEVHTITNLGVVGCPAYETQAQFYQGAVSSSNLLKTVTTDYTSTLYQGPFYSALVNVVPIRVTTSWQLVGGGTNVAKVEKDYDAGFSSGGYTGLHYGSVVTEREYDYGPGSPGSLIRTTSTNYQYLVNGNYLTYNILDAIYSSKVQDGSGNQLAYAFFGYDESTPNASGITLQHNGAPANGNYRANQTSTHRWLNTTGGYLVGAVSFYDTGMPYQANDPLQHTTTFAYSTTFYGAHVTQATDASNQNIKYDYDFNTGLASSSTDANSQVTSYTYDSLNRLVQTTYPSGGGTDTFCYTDTGGSGCSQSGPPYKVVETRQITGSLNKITTTVVDGLGRVTQTQLNSDPDGVTYVDTTYDGAGRKAAESNPYRTTSDPTYGITTFQYDALGRLTKTIPPDGTATTDNTTTDYSAFPLITVTDEAGRSRKTQSDVLGRLTNVWEDPGGLNFQTIYQYDVLGNLLCVEQHGSATTGTGCSSQPSNDATSPWRVRRFTYDSLSHLLTAKNPESGTTTYNYDSDGNVITKLDARAITTTYSYDNLHRNYQKTYSDGTATVKYGFDGVAGPATCPPTITVTNAVGRRTAMCDGAGTTSWSYDPMGRELTEQRTIGSVTQSVSYTYNFDGSGATLTYPSGRVVTYTSSAAGRDVSAVDSANGISYVTGVTYAPQGALSLYSSTSNGNTASTAFTYNSRLQPLQLYSTLGTISSSTLTQLQQGTTCPTAVGTIMSRSYNFGLGSNDNGRIQSIINCRDSNRTQNFTYDSLNRVSTAYTTGANWGEDFTMDSWGNLTNRSVHPGKMNYELLNVSAALNNQLTGFAYDADGNMIQNGSATYTYDGENQLTATAGLTYTYNGDGERVKKSSGTLYWGEGPLLETDLSGNLTAEYIFFGGKRVARRDASGTIRYYFADHLGSASVITDTNGVIKNESDYYPYGGEIAITSGDSNHYKFIGKERDSESGLDNFGARYDSSALGRFMTPDWDGNQPPFRTRSLVTRRP